MPGLEMARLEPQEGLQILLKQLHQHVVSTL